MLNRRRFLKRSFKYGFAFLCSLSVHLSVYWVCAICSIGLAYETDASARSARSVQTEQSTENPPLSLAQKQQTREQKKGANNQLTESDISIRNLDSFFEQNSEVARKAYEIQFIDFPEWIQREFDRLSLLKRDQKLGLASEKEALKKAKIDRRILKQLFLQHGCFDIKITIKIQMHETSQKNAVIAFLCSSGERYKISHRRIDYKQDAFDSQKIQKKIFTEKTGYIEFERIELERQNLLKFFKRRGYFFTTVAPPIINSDPKTKEATLTYQVNLNKKAVVSDIVVTGMKNVPAKFILNRATLKKGDILTSSEVDNSRRDLIETGLFSNINLLVSKGSSEKDHTNALINIDVLEMPPRKISAGANYSESEGAFFLASWEHKNFLKKAHNIGFIEHIGTKGCIASVFYNIPDALRKNQKIHMDITARYYDTKAFDGEKASASIGCLQLWKAGRYEIEGTFLPTIEKSELKRKKTYKQTLTGFQSNLKVNLSNHKFYPTKGVVLNMGFNQYFGHFPYIDPKQESLETDLSSKEPMKNHEVHALSNYKGTLTGYIPLSRKEFYEQNSPILAIFLKAGGTLIKDLEHIPFDKRFYGGGRNSIRSYGYQMSGELEPNGTPIGAASLFEACIEPRVRISQDFGMIFFLDYSSLCNKKAPSIYKKGCSRGGCGFGLRYFTQFGPIRLDFGFPFKRRVKTTESPTTKKKYIDKRVQFYISVGQAF